MTKIILKLADKIISVTSEIGEIALLIWGIILSTPRIFRDRKLILEQMAHVGVNSIPLVIIIGFFTGAVSAWQAAMAKVARRIKLASAAASSLPRSCRRRWKNARRSMRSS